MSVSRRRAPLSRINNRISDTRGTRKARRSVINGHKKEIKPIRVPPRPRFPVRCDPKSINVNAEQATGIYFISG